MGYLQETGTMQGNHIALLLFCGGLLTNWFEPLEAFVQRSESLLSICELKREVGPCAENIRRYYYNIKTRTCERFDYSGCKGNENNFKTKADCIMRCQSDEPVPNICDLSKKEGNCSASIPRYYHNVENRKCELFLYSGCEGNQNNFKAKKDCMVKCNGVESLPAVCKLSKKTGPCAAAIDRYYYNLENRRCQIFTYSSCGGNGNNFYTLADCIVRCKGDELLLNICELSLVVGHCADNIPRYYYDIHNRRCQKFLYSGCGGNENNFKTEADCIKKCKR